MSPGLVRALVIASAVLSAAGSVPVIRNTLRGKDKPVPVSWLLWAGILAIGGVAALDAGQVPAAVYLIACAAECALVGVLALRIPAADRDPPVTVRLPRAGHIRLDLICLAGGVVGLVLLAAVRAPGAAVAVSVATDLLAYIPTMVHAWHEPGQETWSTYALYASGALLALVVADHRVFAAVAYPAYLLVADTAVSYIILTRREHARR
jgi:hypothetical protein